MPRIQETNPCQTKYSKQFVPAKDQREKIDNTAVSRPWWDGIFLHLWPDRARPKTAEMVADGTINRPEPPPTNSHSLPRSCTLPHMSQQIARSDLPCCYFFPSDPAQTAQINSNSIAKEPKADLTPYLTPYLRVPVRSAFCPPSLHRPLLRLSLIDYPKPTSQDSTHIRHWALLPNN